MPIFIGAFGADGGGVGTGGGAGVGAGAGAGVGAGAGAGVGAGAGAGVGAGAGAGLAHPIITKLITTIKTTKHEINLFIDSPLFVL